jgi:hypothetical protein
VVPASALLGYTRWQAEARTLFGALQEALPRLPYTATTGRNGVEMETGNSQDNQAARAARNQSLYRAVNERVKEINEAFDELLPLGDWICECANETCVERLALTHEEYEMIRATPTRFAVAPHARHVYPEVESTVEKHERYWVVEKTGVAAEVVEQTNPRA